MAGDGARAAGAGMPSLSPVHRLDGGATVPASGGGGSAAAAGSGVEVLDMAAAVGGDGATPDDEHAVFMRFARALGDLPPDDDSRVFWGLDTGFLDKLGCRNRLIRDYRGTRHARASRWHERELRGTLRAELGLGREASAVAAGGASGAASPGAGGAGEEVDRNQLWEQLQRACAINAGRAPTGDGSDDELAALPDIDPDSDEESKAGTIGDAGSSVAIGTDHATAGSSAGGSGGLKRVQTAGSFALLMAPGQTMTPVPSELGPSAGVADTTPGGGRVRVSVSATAVSLLVTTPGQLDVFDKGLVFAAEPTHKRGADDASSRPAKGSHAECVAARCVRVCAHVSCFCEGGG